MTDPNKINTFFTDSIFNDIDQYAEVARKWDIDFTQLEPGKLNAEMTILTNSDFQILRTSYNKTLIQNGSSPKNLVSFGIPRLSSSHFFWRGKKIEENNICVFPISGEIATESKAGFDVYVVSFPQDYIALACELLDYPFLMRKIINTEVVTVSKISMSRLRTFLEKLFGNLHNQNEFIRDVKFIETIKQEILKQLLITIEAHLNTSKTYPIRLRDQAFTKAKKYILENQSKPFTVQILVEETNVSIRTLEYSFLERFGVTPKAILKAIRLNGVHKELKSTLVKKRIADTATCWGFWHMGQFANDYKKMFGELPSKTLSANK